MLFLLAPTMAHLSIAVLCSALLGYGLSWAMDRLFLSRVVEDGVARVALSCAVTFLLLMGGMTFALSWTKPEYVANSVIIPPLGYAISFVLGLAIVGVLRMRAYGAEYERNDDQAVFDVDLDDQSIYDEEVLAFDARHGHRGYLRRHWAGHLSLPLSYWVNGALLAALIGAAAEFVAMKLKTGGGSLRGIAILALSYFLVATIFWMWSSVGIWRSAYWHRRRGGAAGWAVAARVLIVLSAAGTLVRSGDIALQAAELGQLAVGRDSLGAVAAMRVSPDRRDLILTGAIAAGTAERFGQVLANAPHVEKIVLTSTGGRMLEAQRMAELIRARGLDSEVDGHCMSACTELLLAGRERYADEEARIGFHQPSFPGARPEELRTEIEGMRQDYVAAGVDPAFAWRAISVPAEGMWFPGFEEMLQAGVLTGSAPIVIRGGAASAD
jgi:hypothetical protein